MFAYISHDAESTVKPEPQPVAPKGCPTHSNPDGFPHLAPGGICPRARHRVGSQVQPFKGYRHVPIWYTARRSSDNLRLAPLVSPSTPLRNQVLPDEVRHPHKCRLHPPIPCVGWLLHRLNAGDGFTSHRRAKRTRPLSLTF